MLSIRRSKRRKRKGGYLSQIVVGLSGSGSRKLKVYQPKRRYHK